MKIKILLILFLLLILQPMTVYAMEFDAPAAPEGVEKYIPEEDESFASGVWYVIKTAIGDIRPDLKEATATSLSLIAVVMLLSITSKFSGITDQVIQLSTAVCLGLIMLRSTKSFLYLGKDTVARLCDYGKLLLPSLTAATAAAGGTSTSVALYSGTYIFVTIFSTLVNKCIIPLTYIYLCFSICNCAFQNDVFVGMKKFVKWLSTWLLKTIMFVFTGYMGITGAISGSVDTAALKATKLTINGAVPVVGGALSDASEAILVSAGIMKNAVGVYGIFVFLAICIGPFLKVGVHYLILKFTTAICSILTSKGVALIQEMSEIMGVVLAITGVGCLMLLISVVCFIRCNI